MERIRFVDRQRDFDHRHQSAHGEIDASESDHGIKGLEINAAQRYEQQIACWAQVK